MNRSGFCRVLSATQVVNWSDGKKVFGRSAPNCRSDGSRCVRTNRKRVFFYLQAFQAILTFMDLLGWWKLNEGGGTTPLDVIFAGVACHYWIFEPLVLLAVVNAVFL